MRRETVELVRQALAENRRAYVLVNNRSEGNAPLTIQALNDRLRDMAPWLESIMEPQVSGASKSFMIQEARPVNALTETCFEQQ